jgi:ABC-2 type transport system permease protein
MELFVSSCRTTIWFWRLSLLRQVQHPLHCIGWLVFNPLQYLFWYFILTLVLSRCGTLADWNKGQIMFLYGLALMSHGIMVTLFIETWDIDSTLSQGGFDRMLVRPIGMFSQYGFSYLNLIGIADLVPGAIFFFYSCHVLNFYLNVSRLALITLTVIGAVLIRASLFIIVSSVSFWTRKSRSLTEVTMVVVERGASLPLALYPIFIQAALTYFLPLGFIAFYPSTYLLGITPAIHLSLNPAITTFLVGATLFSLALWVFGVGLQRYESSGS